MREEWKGFTTGEWAKEVNVRDFIQKNYTPYDGDASFLAGPTQATTDLWNQVLDLQKQERAAGGVLDMDTKVVQTITSHGAGYLDKDKEYYIYCTQGIESSSVCQKLRKKGYNVINVLGGYHDYISNL